MKQLLLMRHAKSSWADSSMDDHDRPLNPRGQRDAPRMADWILEQGIAPDRILCSSALRTRQTADVMSLSLGCGIDVVDELYLARVEIWQQVLAAHFRHEVLLAIGHNPGIEEFIARVSDDYYAMPTAAIAVFDVSSEANRFNFDDLSLKAIWKPKEI